MFSPSRVRKGWQGAGPALVATSRVAAEVRIIALCSFSWPAPGARSTLNRGPGERGFRDPPAHCHHHRCGPCRRRQRADRHLPDRGHQQHPAQCAAVQLRHGLTDEGDALSGAMRRDGGPMRRVVGVVAAGLGTFLLVSGLLLRFYMAGQVVKFPLNEYRVMTLEGKNVTYFSPSLLKDVPGVSMRVTRTIEGDVAAGTSSRAVWTQFSYAYDATHGVTYQALTQRSAFDRRTGALIGCCGEAVGAYTGRQSGLAFTWPIGTKQRSYQIFDTTLLKPVPVQFAGQEHVDGLAAYRFVERVPAQRFSKQKLPG